MKNILFVCVGNSCRSQIAEGFARHYGAGVLNAASAGLSCTHSVARETVEVMMEKGIDISDQFPKDFEPGLAVNYDVIVNISGFELPPVWGPILTEWEIRDPYGQELSVHRKVRDEVEERIKALIADLQSDSALTEYAPVGQRIAPDPGRRRGLWQRFTRRR